MKKNVNSYSLVKYILYIVKKLNEMSFYLYSDHAHIHAQNIDNYHHHHTISFLIAKLKLIQGSSMIYFDFFKAL